MYSPIFHVFLYPFGYPKSLPARAHTLSQLHRITSRFYSSFALSAAAAASASHAVAQAHVAKRKRINKRIVTRYSVLLARVLSSKAVIESEPRARAELVGRYRLTISYCSRV
ncbi:hypothetical protein BDW02DRAFT_364910 [Decorospora gaudefroyi]|uniref:Uncharacterized protein n=1 Tax=Decorospora gaudefroyi TaxID=184978 RepID=A0A6A5KR87_9PLEO|nr:hypothetical protein BDW02DRAFT_364910 [Decorospora gaudefroyi]